MTKIELDMMNENVFELIGSDWMLITAGTPDSYNTMTASWGGLGVLWNRNVAICFVRPTRYTYEFLEKADNFTLSFFDEEHREKLNLCGSKSGRDTDKAAATGLVAVSGQLSGTTTFEQARMVLECRKLYFQDIEPARFGDPSIESLYPNKDYHRMYIGEIVNCMMK